MTTEDTPRPGSTIDLSRRMERIEGKYDDLAAEVAGLTGTVTRVELNQTHQAELNKLRFDSLDVGVKGVESGLKAFMTRIEGIITGEIRTSQTAQGEKIIADYLVWQKTVEDRFDSHEKVVTQARLLGSLVKLLVAGNVIAIIAGVAAILKP